MHIIINAVNVDMAKSLLIPCMVMQWILIVDFCLLWTCFFHSQHHIEQTSYSHGTTVNDNGVS